MWFRKTAQKWTTRWPVDHFQVAASAAPATPAAPATSADVKRGGIYPLPNMAKSVPPVAMELAIQHDRQHDFWLFLSTES